MRTVYPKIEWRTDSQGIYRAEPAPWITLSTGLRLGGDDAGTWSAIMNGASLTTGHGDFGYQFDSEESAKSALKDALHKKIDRDIQNAIETLKLYSETKHETENFNLTEAEKRMSMALERERSAVAEAVTHMKRAIAGRGHLRYPGRGSYAWDDERYQHEFGGALDELFEAMAPLEAIAKDWSDCPTDPDEIKNARDGLDPKAEFHKVLQAFNKAAYEIFKTKVYKDTTLFPDLDRHEIRELVGKTNDLVDRHAPAINQQ